MPNKILTAVNRLNKIIPLAERQKNLTPETNAVYQMILKSYVESGRSLNKAEMSEHVENIEETINILRLNDMVIFDSKGEPTGAYPFTMEQREHKIKINGKKIHAMCALDALAISPMFKLKTHIDSKCFVTGRSISIDQMNQKILNHDEHEALHFGINWNAATNNCCATSLCTEMIFLIDKDVAQTWLSKDQQNREVFDIDDAIEFACRFFKALITWDITLSRDHFRQ